MLGQLKKLIRKLSHPLQQLLRRIEEQQSFTGDRSSSTTTTIKTSCEHKHGPLIPCLKGVRQYKKLQTSHWTVSLDDANSCVMICGGVPAIVKNIIKTEDTISLICAKFKAVTDAFNHPLPSSKLSICKAEGEHKGLVIVSISDVLQKCVCLPVLSDTSSFVIIPFVH